MNPETLTRLAEAAMDRHGDLFVRNERAQLTIAEILKINPRSDVGTLVDVIALMIRNGVLR